MFDHLFSSSGLSLERLNTLIKLSEAGSLIRAAGNDSGRQSRMSHQLKELSSFFGVDLTCRSGRSVRLTPLGEDLVLLIREQFTALDSFRGRASGLVPTFSIATGDSIAQWLVVPAIANLRNKPQPTRFRVLNLRTRESITRLKELRAEFGVLRADAVVAPLSSTFVCEQRYAAFVPRRLVTKRSAPTIKEALLNYPHAAVSGDGQLIGRLQDLGRSFKGHQFTPDLSCESIGQCHAAVETGQYAAILPVQAWKPKSPQDYWVVEDPALKGLTRRLVLAWHPRTIAVRGSSAQKCQQALLAALKQSGQSAESP